MRSALALSQALRRGDRLDLDAVERLHALLSARLDAYVPPILCR